MHNHPHFKLREEGLFYLDRILVKKKRELIKSDLVEFGAIIPFKKIRENRKITGKVILIEPHPDDIALSIGAYVINLIEEGYDVEILNIFSDSTTSTLKNNNILKFNDEEYTKTRIEESRFVFNQLLSVDFTTLGEPVAFKRGHKSIFQRDTYEIDNSIKSKILYQIKKRVEQGANKLVFPMGVKGHIDHKVCYLAGLEAVKKYKGSHIEILFYEELPYSKNKFAYFEQLTNLKKAIDISPIYLCIGRNLEDKVSMILSYRSQNFPIKREEIRFRTEYESRVVFDEARFLGEKTKGCSERLWMVK